MYIKNVANILLNMEQFMYLSDCTPYQGYFVSDQVTLPIFLAGYRRLRQGAVPSVNLPAKSFSKKKSPRQPPADRSLATQPGRDGSTSPSPAADTPSHDSPASVPSALDVGQAPELGAGTDVCDSCDSDGESMCCSEPAPRTGPQPSSSSTSVATQTDRAQSFLSIYDLSSKPVMVQHYTGFKDLDHFMFVYNLFAEEAAGLQCYSDTTHTLRVLANEDCFFLTLIKLKRNMCNVELALLFGVSHTVVSMIFNTWVSFLYYTLKEYRFEDTKPRKGDVRMIVDCTEIHMTKPSQALAQQATYSTYKGANTVKVLVGILPCGMICFVSDAYGGSFSDRAIFEKSGILNVLEKGDTILSDRGFNVKDLLDEHDIVLNVPTSLKGKSRLTPAERSYSQHVSTRRIHVERLIGLAKTYRILSEKLSRTKAEMASRLVYVCFMLSNFRVSIM